MINKKRVPLPNYYPRKHQSANYADTSPTTEEQVTSIPTKRKRRKTKAITSCERCRHAHIKCVSRGPGESCENCAKRAIQPCSFTQPHDEMSAKPAVKEKELGLHSPQVRHLQFLAASAIAYMEEQASEV